MNEPLNRLQKQMHFLMEIDKLKLVLRQSGVSDKSRRENTAEHSWHIAVMAIFLLEHCLFQNLDMLRVIKMLLVHDIVEIEAGDVSVYDESANLNKAERENQAAQNLFGLLPPDQAAQIMAYWREFEEGKTEEALYANAIDRIAPVLLNFKTEGYSWTRQNVTKDQVVKICREKITKACPGVWSYMEGMLEEAVRQGYLLPDSAGVS